MRFFSKRNFCSNKRGVGEIGESIVFTSAGNLHRYSGMKYFALILLFSLSSLVQAQESCALEEIDSTTKKHFTEQQWDQQLEQWMSEEPASPGLLRLGLAFAVYTNEKPKTKKLRGDKRKHCYMGCRISQELGYETAEYVAWLKEHEDLTDCNGSTYFEIRDFEVTVYGAELGQTSKDPAFCIQECNQIKRY